MKKLVSALVLTVVGLAALAVASPMITRLIAALVPLVVVAGIVATVFLIASRYTRKW